MVVVLAVQGRRSHVCHVLLPAGRSMPTLCESIGPKNGVNSSSAMVKSRMTDFDGHQSIGF